MAAGVRLARLYGALPANLSMDSQRLELLGSAAVHMLTVEADEMWSFVSKKSSKQWIWIALHGKTRQIITFHTDRYDSYVDIIPQEQHRRVT